MYKNILLVGCNNVTFSCIDKLCEVKGFYEKLYVPANSDKLLAHEINSHLVDFIGMNKFNAISRHISQVLKHKVEECNKLDHMKISDWTRLSDGGCIVINTAFEEDDRRIVHKNSAIFHLPVIDVAADGDLFSVFVTVPFVTEQFYRLNDVMKKPEYPECAIKSFPTELGHCVEWSKRKFKNLLFKSNDPDSSIAAANCGFQFFIKWFSHKPKQMLISLPEDHINSRGELFWKSRKCPKSIDFSPHDSVCIDFVHAVASILCSITDIEFDLTRERIEKLASNFQAEPFIPKSDKVIVDNEAVKAAEEQSFVDKRTFASGPINQFLVSATKLKLRVYQIEEASSSEITRNALDVSACDNKASSQAASHTIDELKKLMEPSSKDGPLHSPNCYFGNVGAARGDENGVYSANLLPSEVKKLGSISFNEWDVWDFSEPRAHFTLEEFLAAMKLKTEGLSCTMIGLRDSKPSRTIYVDVLHSESKRKKQTLRDLIGEEFVDEEIVMLDLVFEHDNDEDMGPPLKYAFSRQT
ncbi:Ubiquitin-activating enzyme E1 2 [Halotydeus destructor]|nr:Ubiquitin-activating enzyme E1 2 [Halotydeus destructor]